MPVFISMGQKFAARAGVVPERYSSMRMWLALAFIGCLALSGVAAQTSDIIPPGPNLEVHGVPPIPVALAQSIAPFQGWYGLPLAGWHPSKKELWLKGLSSVAWISRVSKPGEAAQVTPIYIQEDGIYDLYFQPQGRYLAYTRDAKGNEAFQLHLYDIGSRTSQRLTDGTSRNTEPVWAKSGEQIVYSSSPGGGNGVNLRLINPFKPTGDHLLTPSTGSYLKAYDWSPDDKFVVYCDYQSNTTNTLWLVEAATGKKTQLSPKTATPELFDNPQFSPDGAGLYLITDHEADVRRLAYVDLASKKWLYLTSRINWDVEEFKLAPDGKTIAFVVNEDGISRLHLLDLQSNREKPVGSMPVGLISDLQWHSDSLVLAFNFKSPNSPNDVLALNLKTGQTEIWARSNTNGYDPGKLSIPQPIRWQSFDGLSISGYIARPPQQFTGKRPVIIDLHGGPEEQYRPGFGYEDNYYINELGVAKVYPNARGSSGYGKRFLKLDNGLLRENAVKDVGALLDWIKQQPDLDASRVLVQGVSYGGYLALRVANTYGDRLRGAISESGITNLASFVARTEGWRRALQRAEFGDERNPKIKAFMEQTAPVNSVSRLTTPLLIVQGKNDPRVPFSEAEALVKATQGRIPVWYILANDEGHGFVQSANRNFRFLAATLFIKEYLLK